MWDFIKQLISARGVQLLSRYLGTAIVSLATYLGVTLDSDATTKTVVVLATLLIAGLLKVLDHVSHRVQAQEVAKELDAMEDEDLRLRRALVKAQAGCTNLIKLLLVGTLIFAAGCKTTEQIAAAAGAALTTAIAHTSVDVAYDPVTGQAHAVVTFKDAQGRVVEGPLTKAQCERCNDVAKANLKATYKAALKEMEAVEKRELALLKAQRKQCGQAIYIPPVSSIPVATGPQVGDIFVTAATPVFEAPSNDTDEAIINSILDNDDTRGVTASSDRAVIFGNNFPGTSAELHQCVNDAKKNALNLVKFEKFRPADIRLFLNQKCTKANYEKWSAWVLADAKPGDRRIFANSSHGAEDTGADGKIYDIIVTDDMVRKGYWDETTEVLPAYWSNVLRSTSVDYLFINDACHAGGAQKRFGLITGKATRSIDGPLAVQARLAAAVERGASWRSLAISGTVIPACQPAELSEEDSTHGGLGTDAYWRARKSLPLTAKSGDIIREANRILHSEFNATQHMGLIGVNKPLFSE
jgi:hypothetical protein